MYFCIYAAVGNKYLIEEYVSHYYTLNKYKREIKFMDDVYAKEIENMRCIVENTQYEGV